MFCFTNALFAYTSYYTQIPSTAGGTIGIAVKITIPDTPRYQCGAPITVWCKGGRDATSLSISYQTLSNWGVILIQFNFPGGGSSITLSGGTYDLRGINCVTATKDVTRFAMGLIPDMNGNFLNHFCGSINPLYNNVGFMGSSEGGNIAMTVAGMMGNEIPNLAWIHNWEAAIGDGVMTGDCGSDDSEPLHTNPDYDENTGNYNWNNLRWDSLLPVDVDSLTSVHIVGGFYWDSNANNAFDYGVDYYARGFYWNTKYYISDLVLNHAIDLGIYPSNPPFHLPTKIETTNFWLTRNAYHWYDSLMIKFPNLLFISSSRTSDHVTSTDDHPHIVEQIDSMMSNNCPFVRLNPDKVYLELVKHNLLPNAIDNDANQLYDHVNIRSHFQASNLMSITDYKIAGILELCDRVMTGNLDPNLSTVIHPDCNQSASITLSKNNPDCYGNFQLTANIQPAGNYTYQWTPSIGLDNSNISNPISHVINTMTYQVTAIDDSTGISAIGSIVIQPYFPLNVSASSVTSMCGSNNGSASCIVSGGLLPIHYLWNNGATTQTNSNLGTGNYSVTVTDSIGCQSSANTFVSSMTTCGVPANLFVTQLTSTSVILNWNAVDCATSYKLKYKQTGTTIWILIPATINQNNYTLTGLTNLASYEFSVKAVCSVPNTVGSSFSSGYTFLVGQSPCVIPSNLSSSNVTASSAVLHWNAVAGAVSYKLKIRRVGTSSYSTYVVYTNSKSINGLVNSTSYEWNVRSQCGSGYTATSSFTSNVSFTTLAAKLSDSLSETVATQYVISPNPFSTDFSVSWNRFLPEVNQIQLVNLLGQSQFLLNDAEALNADSEVLISTEALPSGFYILLIEDRQGIHSFKILKQ